MAISVNSKNVLKYLQEHPGEDITANQLAEKLGLSSKTVNACFTSSIQKKEYGFRETVVIDCGDGVKAEKKYLRLTDAGMAFDPDATPVEE